MNPTAFEKPPFPALTPAQRWHLEVHGYVLVEDVLTPTEVSALHAALHDLKAEFLATDDPWNAVIRNSRIFGQAFLGDHVHFDNLIEADPLYLTHAVHPRIVGMVEEVVGRGVRLTEMQAAINRRKPGDHYEGAGRHLWHRNRPEALSYSVNGLYHCEHVKAVTFLTDVGPDDGGTCVIPGCHKSGAPEESIVKAVREDPLLIHQVVAKAGSTLIFCETLLHASGDIRSDQERTIIITAYQPWRFRTNTTYEFTPEFEAGVPEPLRRLVFGSDYEPRLRRRTLEMPVGSADPGDQLDGFSLSTGDRSRCEGNHLSRSRLGTHPT